MKKLVFVMMAALSLMFVSCKTTPAPTSSSSSESSTVVVDSTSTEVSGSTAVEKPSKPEGKEDVDVTTPAKPTEEANKPVGDKK